MAMCTGNYIMWLSLSVTCEKSLTGYAWYWWYESGTQTVLTGYAWYWWYESGTQTVLTGYAWYGGMSLEHRLYWHMLPLVVSSNSAHGDVYWKLHYVIKFVSDLRKVGGFVRVLWFLPPIIYNWNIVESGVKHHNINPQTFSAFPVLENTTCE
jgi:hypothetical protein